ncbi:post-PEP-CTERM-1 domain-containing protein [Stenotrophobium rhamnosiphilum]|uniref:Secreted protein n=1 Tax=Stenotrophobium rhamnosiphilum TaxID=2029166 RepID=A0A2T5MDX2_9GAMM|nr:hypothetical protein [Stenotrophobium rhamnosiphilum]PTU30749.1 hypothetical protein CJD38_14780 [Stenotrophobium rhamnosiphilum]
MSLRSGGICVLVLAAFGGFVSADLSAADAQQNQKSTQRIFLDPVTGTPRAPTREELQQLPAVEKSAASAKSTSAPKIVDYPDGTVGLFLHRPKNQIHAEVTADGEIHMHCNDELPIKAQP